MNERIKELVEQADPSEYNTEAAKEFNKWFAEECSRLIDDLGLSKEQSDRLKQHFGVEVYEYTSTPQQKGTAMKPFDLEAAKRGEPICRTGAGPVRFIGLDSKGYVVVESLPLCYEAYYAGELSMVPNKRTVWVNLYPSGYGDYYESETLADKDAGANRIGGKAYPLEIEE